MRLLRRLLWFRRLAAAIPPRDDGAVAAERPCGLTELRAALIERAERAAAALAAGDAGTARALLETPLPVIVPASEEDRLGLAATLAMRGHQAAAAAVLAPVRGASAKAALAFARAASAGAGPAQARAIWADAFAAFPVAAIATSYATALADDLAYADALALLDQWIAADGRASLLLARTRLVERIGSLAEAARAAGAAAAGSADAGLAVEAARLLREIGEAPAEAIAAAPTATADRGWPAAARREANTLIARGELAAAATLLGEVVARRGEANDGFALVNAVTLTGDVDRGRALSAEFAAQFTGDLRFPLKLAQLAERAGDARGMIDGFSRVLAVDPTSVAGASGVARGLVQAGMLAAARDWLTRADERAVWPASMLAFVEARAGRAEAVRSALDDAYRRGAAPLAAYRAGRARDPADCLMPDGRHLSHPAPRFQASSALFDRFLDRLGSGGRTVLVGNSPRLLDEGRGATIDACDTIIRLNDFRIAGFEASVGSRTDWWFSSANRQAQPDRTSVGAARSILTQTVPQHVPELPAFTRGRLGLDLEPDQACFLPPFLHSLSGALLYPGHSTGLRMILMLEFVVHAPFEAVGFDFFESGELHYFENKAGRLLIGETHAVDFERRFVADVLQPYARFGRYAL